jgi:hypothetical protein
MDLINRLKKLEQSMTEPAITADHEERLRLLSRECKPVFNSEESTAAEDLRCPLHGRRIPADVLSLCGELERHIDDPLSSSLGSGHLPLTAV